MQPTDNGQQGVILGADTLHALIHALDATATHIGAVRLMLSSLMADGAGEISDLMILEKTNRLAGDHVDQAYDVLVNHKALPLERLAQDLQRLLSLAAPATRHPLGGEI